MIFESFLFEPAAAGMSVTDVHRCKGMLHLPETSASVTSINNNLFLKPSLIHQFHLTESFQFWLPVLVWQTHGHLCDVFPEKEVLV